MRRVMVVLVCFAGLVAAGTFWSDHSHPSTRAVVTVQEPSPTRAKVPTPTPSATAAKAKQQTTGGWGFMAVVLVFMLGGGMVALGMAINNASGPRPVQGPPLREQIAPEGPKVHDRWHVILSAQVRQSVTRHVELWRGVVNYRSADPRQVGDFVVERYKDATGPHPAHVSFSCRATPSS